MEQNTLVQGDCLEKMHDITDKSIDMILCDLPYGTTRCAWDAIIPFEPLWKHYTRIIKSHGAIVLTATQPFTTKLIASNMNMFRYCWVWQKTSPTGYLNANKMPMRAHEDIAVFYKKLPTYNPQMTTGHERKVSTARHKRNCIKTNVYGDHQLIGYDSTERYPISIQIFPTDKQSTALHSTQKPVALFEYLVRTYTNPGEVVLDNAIGSGTTAIACIRQSRNYIGIELRQDCCEVARLRISRELSQPKLFNL